MIILTASRTKHLQPKRIQHDKKSEAENIDVFALLLLKENVALFVKLHRLCSFPSIIER